MGCLMLISEQIRADAAGLLSMERIINVTDGNC